jgi:hypothetical protein
MARAVHVRPRSCGKSSASGSASKDVMPDQPSRALASARSSAWRFQSPPAKDTTTREAPFLALSASCAATSSWLLVTSVFRTYSAGMPKGPSGCHSEPAVPVICGSGKGGAGHPAHQDGRDHGGWRKLDFGPTSRSSSRVGWPAIRPGRARSGPLMRRPRSRRGTPAAAQDASWRSPPAPTPRITRLPDTCWSEATCLATHTTGCRGGLSRRTRAGLAWSPLPRPRARPCCRSAVFPTGDELVDRPAFWLPHL